MPIESLGTHDVGGVKANIPLLPGERYVGAGTPEIFEQWEAEVDTLVYLLKDRVKGLYGFRSHIEELEPTVYWSMKYYERWIYTLARMLLNSNVISPTELDEELGLMSENEYNDFCEGQYVQVRLENLRTRWRKPHLRSPGYIHGKVGIVERVLGEYPNPELTNFGNLSADAKQRCYRVRFKQHIVWPDYDGPVTDSIEVEIFHHWLTPATKELYGAQSLLAADEAIAHGSVDKHEHSHDHDHGHSHEARHELEQKCVEQEGPESPWRNLLGAIKRLLYRKGLTSEAELRSKVESWEATQSTGWRVGAKVVARAWSNEQFKADLLAHAQDTIFKEFGVRAGQGAELIVVENSNKVHNLIVCTLCSCYPTGILGRSPLWYKSRNYRARAVREPRKVLQDFGTLVNEEVEVKVHDSTAEMRYIVLPMRPTRTEGWSEDELADLVTRDHLIGVSIPE